LSCDPESDTNLISHSLVTDVLGVHIHRFDKESTPYGGEHIHASEAYGYVDLVWCFEKNSKRLHSTRFIVSSSPDAPYDVVLGKRDAEHCDMLGPKTRHKRQ